MGTIAWTYEILSTTTKVIPAFFGLLDAVLPIQIVYSILATIKKIRAKFSKFKMKLFCETTINKEINAVEVGNSFILVTLDQEKILYNLWDFAGEIVFLITYWPFFGYNF